MRRRAAWDDDAEDADRREHEAPRVREREAGSSRSIRLRSWDDAREGSAEHGEAAASDDVREGSAETGEAAASDDVREGLADDAASSGSDFEIVDPDPQQEFCEEMIFLYLGRVVNARQFAR